MHRYRVTAVYKEKEYVLHDPVSMEQIYDDELIEEVGKPASFRFYISPDHENIRYIKPLETKINLYDNGVEQLDFRVIGDAKDIINTGEIKAAGALSYLSDSQQKPTEYTGGINAFIDLVLTRHNEQSHIKVTRGTVTVVDSNDYINRTWSSYTDTLTLLNDKLVKSHGGYLVMRHIIDNSYVLDYLSEFGRNEQIVRLGENLLDITSEVDASEVYSRLIPIGAEIASTEETSLKQYTTIETVNNGLLYIERADLIEKYGIITKVKEWKDVTLPQNLLTKARTELNAADMPRSFDVNILDLSVVEDVQGFGLGKLTRVSVPSMELELDYMLTKQTKHITAPQNDKLTLGAVQKSMTQSQNEEHKDVTDQVTQAEINSSNQTINTGKTISGANGGFVVLDAYDKQGKLTKPWRILIMDSEQKSAAKDVIQLNVNGIGFSNNGVDGEYRNAWTIDGKLNADFIRTGSLIVGGKSWNTDGKIEVRDKEDNVIGTFSKDGIEIINGRINSPHISGGSASFADGQFYVDESSAYIGGFYTFQTEWGDYLATEDAMVGIGSSAFWSFWAGNRNGESGAKIDASDPEQVLTSYGIAMSQEQGYFQELYINHPIFVGRDKYWGIGETIDDLYGRIDSLESQIASIGSGGNE